MMRLREAPLTGRRILAIVLAFFGAVTAVNATMVWLAFDSFPGVVSHDAYREGLAWNRRLEARRVQELLGWNVDVTASGAATDSIIAAEFRDANGAPLTDLEVVARMVRPVVQGQDRVVTLRREAPGVYVGRVELPAPGSWRLKLEAARDEHVVWRMERALWLE